MRLTRTITILMLLAVFVLGTCAYAETDQPTASEKAVKSDKPEKMRGHPMMDGKRGDKFIERLTDQLKLTEKQQTSIRDIVAAHHAKTMQLRMDTTITQKALIQHERELLKKLNSEIGAILTPEQKEQFDKMHKEMRDSMGERKEMRDEKKEMKREMKEEQKELKEEKHDGHKSGN